MHSTVEPVHPHYKARRGGSAESRGDESQADRGRRGKWRPL